jgi:hypothetical protein
MTGREWNQYLKTVQENRNRDPLTVKRYDERVASAPDLTDEQRDLVEKIAVLTKNAEKEKPANEDDLYQTQMYNDTLKQIEGYKQDLKRTGMTDAQINGAIGTGNPAARTVQ